MLNWVKYGLWQIDYVHASDYVNEGEEVHDDYIDSDDKSSDEKGEKTFDQRVLINRTKPQPCDQEVFIDIKLFIVLIKKKKNTSYY